MTTAEALERIRKATREANPALVSAVMGANIAGLNIDPWLAAIIMGFLMVDQPSEDPEEDRRRTLDEWKPRIKKQLAAWAEEAEAQSTASTSQAIVTAPALEGEYIPPSRVPPSPGDAGALSGTIPSKPPPPALPSGQGVTGTLIPAPPPGMPEPLREAWIQAKVRAGEYARGLGSVIRQWPNDVEREVWQGEAIVTEVDAETRRAKRAAIRDLTAQAVEKRWTPEKLASELGHKTQEWSRNWGRTAATELQNAHNEGVAISALRSDGPEARVARIPESNACADCKRLFLGKEGQPRVFTVAELAENGTNVGKPRSEWLPTLTAVHPRCRCQVFSLPNGMKLNTNGRLVAE